MYLISEYFKKIKFNKKIIFIIFIILIIIFCYIVIFQYNDLISVNIDNKKGNIEQDNFQKNNLTIEEDITPPITILIEGPNGIIYDDTVSFLWSGTDDMTNNEYILYSYKLENVDEEWSFWTTLDKKTYRNLSNGNYTFFVRSIDEAGNIDSDPINISFTINIGSDKNKIKSYYVYWPVKKENVELDEPYFVKKRQIFQKKLSISQINLKNINFILNWEDDYTSKIFNFGKDVLTYKIKLGDEELYNQKSIGEGTLIYNLEDINKKPTLSIIKAENLSNAYKNIHNYSNFNITDETFVLEVNIKVRELRILPRLRDKGNDFSLEVNYEYYDTQISEIKDKPPETNILEGPKGEIYEKNVMFSWIGSDDLTNEDEIKYSFKLEPYDKSWSEWIYDTSFNYINLKTGDYSFFVKAMDQMDNVDQTPAERSFTIKKSETDVTAPTIVMLSGPSGLTDNTTHIFNWIGYDELTSSEFLRYRYILEGKDSDWSNWDFSTEKTYNDIFNGQYNFIVEAIDESGNIAQANRSFIVEQWNNFRFISKIIEFNPGQYASSNVDSLLGGPKGCGEFCGSTDVLSLGNNGSITVGFDVQIQNGLGDDFILFENSFFITGNSDEVFAELMYVEVSSDNIHFSRFPSISLTKNPVGNKGININNVTNLGGIYPVLSNVVENNINPFIPVFSGGDAFDLDSLVSNPFVQSGLVDLDDINFIRLIDIPGDGSCFDSLGNPIYDPTEPQVNGADIDAISIINFKEKS